MECNTLLVPAWAIELCCGHSQHSLTEAAERGCAHTVGIPHAENSSSVRLPYSTAHFFLCRTLSVQSGCMVNGRALPSDRLLWASLELIFSLNWAGAVAWWSRSSPFLLPMVLSGCTQRLFRTSENKLVQRCQPWVISTRISFNPSPGPGISGYFPLSSVRKQTWKG